MRVTELVEEPFINEFGQKIEVGEEVVYAGSSWKRTNIRKGVFKGVRYANVTRSEYITDENGAYILEDFKDRWGSTYKRYKMLTKTQREIVSITVKSYAGKKYKYVKDENGTLSYVKTDEDLYRNSTLPLKRVYKFSTGLSEMAGKSF
jgi:hypothetical protein